MAIRDASLERALASGNMEKARLLRKANQEWDLANLALQDEDHKAAKAHIDKAREYQRRAREEE